METQSVAWGDLSAWISSLLSAASVLLALIIFFRDRAQGDRAQVDLVGVWGTTALCQEEFDELKESQAWHDGILRSIVVKLHIRNASNLPVRIARLSYAIKTKWNVPVLDGPTDEDGRALSWEVVQAPQPRLMFVDNFTVPPLETITTPEVKLDVSDLVPDGATGLGLVDHSEVVVTWILVNDNSGRRWEIRPTSGKSARRISRRWRPQEYQPAKW